MALSKLQLRGGAAKLWSLVGRWEREGWDSTRESNVVLMEGPAGTGKTAAALMLFRRIAEKYPGCTLTFARTKKVDVNEKVVPDFDRDILGENHYARNDGVTQKGRRQYKFRNGSRIDIMGFDQPDRWRSYQTDCVYINEATLLSATAFRIMLSRVRLWTPGMPFQLVLLDTNPDDPAHYLNVIADLPHPKHKYPQMHRLLSRHKDNPKFWDRESNGWTKEGQAYIEGTLETLTGPERERLLLGNWATVAGRIYRDFHEATHVLDSLEGIRFRYYFADIDWGVRDPFVFQVYGVEPDGSAVLVHEVFATGKDPVWCADKMAALTTQFNITFAICPHDQPGYAMLARQRGVPLRSCPVKSIATGIGIVQSWLRVDPVAMKPRLRFYRYALEQVDESLARQHKPCSTVQEFSGYKWVEDVDGKPIKEQPDPLCSDHGMDAMRYGISFLEKMGDARTYSLPTAGPEDEIETLIETIGKATRTEDVPGAYRDLPDGWERAR